MAEAHTPAPFLIYGANGYTGRLVALEARARGLRPVLAGRNAHAIEGLARELGFEARPFDLQDTAGALAALKGIHAVLHCAGPFSATSRPMLDACVKTRAHYLDITGEIEVFEAVHARHDECVRAGISVIPGVGFDVVPTDCLAALLKRDLPDASILALAIFPDGGKTSPGTARTAVEGLAGGGRIRQNGKLVRVPAAYKTREIPINGKYFLGVTIPWGDVSTAYYSTGIPNVAVYLVAKPGLIRQMRLLRLFGGILGLKPVQVVLKGLIKKCVKGPDEHARQSGRMWVWGEVMNDGGAVRSRTLVLPEGYRFTVASALAAVERVLQGGLTPGYQTPSLAFGPEFVFSLPEVKWMQ